MDPDQLASLRAGLSGSTLFTSASPNPGLNLMRLFQFRDSRVLFGIDCTCIIQLLTIEALDMM